MASVFAHMPGGRWWGALFFLFMIFAAMSTVLGVCENILAMVRELTGWSRPKGCLVCGIGIFLLALTTALGYSVLHFQPSPTTFCRSVPLSWHCSAATASDGDGIPSLRKPTPEKVRKSARG